MSDVLLQIKDVHKKLGGQSILKGVNLEVSEGENMVIIGRSGGGKSVLLRHMMGLIKPDKGQVIFRGKDLAPISEENLTSVRREMGMLFQNGALFDSLNVGENVAFSMREAGKPDDEIEKEVQRALKIVDLPGQENKMPSDLSGGMRKRVALARAAVSRPKLMLYDEPTAGLDPIISDSINKLILRLGEEYNMTAIIVTHDMISAYEVGDRIAMLHDGRIYCVQTPSEIQDSQDEIVKRFVRGISQPSDAIF